MKPVMVYRGLRAVSNEIYQHINIFTHWFPVFMGTNLNQANGCVHFI